MHAPKIDIIYKPKNADECHSCMGAGPQCLGEALKHPSVSRRTGLATVSRCLLIPVFCLYPPKETSRFKACPNVFIPTQRAAPAHPANLATCVHSPLFSSLMPRTQPSSTQPSGNLLSRLADWLVNTQGGTAVSMQRTVAIYGLVSIVFVDLDCLSEIVVAKKMSRSGMPG